MSENSKLLITEINCVIKCHCCIVNYKLNDIVATNVIYFLICNPLRNEHSMNYKLVYCILTVIPVGCKYRYYYKSKVIIRDVRNPYVRKTTEMYRNLDPVRKTADF